MKKFYRPVCILLMVVMIAGCGSAGKAGSGSALSVSTPSAARSVAQSTAQSMVQSAAQSATQSAAKSAAASSATSSSAGLFAYERLNTKEKAVYDAMESAMVNHQNKVPVETLSDDDMKKVFNFVLYDHPEIFWCTSSVRHSLKYSDGTIKTEFEPQYSMTKEERYEYKERIDREVSSWMAAVPSDASDYDKAKILFDTIVANVEYDEASDNNQNIVSVFVNHRSVCKGYARAYQYLLSKAGIESTIVEGSAEGMPHAWNLVKLDGEYYHFDVTWGDPAFSSNNNIDNFINYSYFGVTTKEILKKHTIDEGMVIPECTAVKDNYFVHEGLYFEDKNPAVVGDAIYNGDVKRQKFISLRFKTDDLYQWAKDYFITKQNLFKFYTSSRGIFMYNNDELFIISIIRKKGE
ncbi:MAG: hypothetical protein J5489_00580 [Lachnospiraceae bacterium]|nr:hypothetical protein [Lachnospiraceae bacterium]